MIDITTTRRPRKMARPPMNDAAAQMSADTAIQPDMSALPATNRPRSKTTMVLELLRRPEGATLDQLVAATGWLPHSARAALTGLRKKGHEVVGQKLDEERRVYRISAAHDASAGGSAS